MRKLHASTSRTDRAGHAISRTGQRCVRVCAVNVAILGLGLIGGSLLRSMSAACHQVGGYDADPATRTGGRAAGEHASSTGRWTVADSLGAAVDGADLVAVAVPLPAVGAVFADM